MGKVDLPKTLASVGFGLLDIGAEYADQAYNLKTPLVNFTDALRIGTTVLSGLINYIEYETEFSEVFFYSSLPLTIRSLVVAVKSQIRPAEFTPRTALPVSRTVMM